jgi:spermidine/putrescine transport system permease protein
MPAGRAAVARPFSVRRQTGFTAIAIFCLIALYLPIFALVIFAFSASDTPSVWGGFSLRWFGAALNNDDVIDSAMRSLRLASAAAVIATAAATMAALATTRTRSYRGLSFKYAFISSPLVIPEVVTAVALLIFFSQIRIHSGYSGMGYLIAAHSAFTLPFAYLPIRARLENMDLSLEIASADLYATPWKTFRFVTLPLLGPGILAGFMLAFVVSLDDVVITEFVKTGGQETLPTWLLGQLRRGVTPEMNAISTLFLLISVGIVTIFFFLSNRRN